MTLHIIPATITVAIIVTTTVVMATILIVVAIIGLSLEAFGTQTLNLRRTPHPVIVVGP